jgi:hypothetical protein
MFSQQAGSSSNLAATSPGHHVKNDLNLTSLQSRPETQAQSGMPGPTVSMAIAEESSRSLKESIDHKESFSNCQRDDGYSVEGDHKQNRGVEFSPDI